VNLAGCFAWRFWQSCLGCPFVCLRSAGRGRSVFEAGDPRCSSAGQRRPIFCQCLLAPLYAARQCYKNGRCGSRRGCLWPELWTRRPSLTSHCFLALVIPPASRSEVTAVERHPPVIPTAVEGSLLLRASAAANLKFSFRSFRLRPQIKPIPSSPPKATRRVRHHKIQDSTPE